MTGNIVWEIWKWVRNDLWREGVLLVMKNIKITKRIILHTLLIAIAFFSLIYLYFLYNTISLAYQYSYDAKVKSQLVSNNYIAESEYYVAQLQDIPHEFSQDFVKPLSVVYYQEPKSIFALK